MIVDERPINVAQLLLLVRTYVRTRERESTLKVLSLSCTSYKEQEKP